MKENIAALEEANLDEKPWQMAGEASAKSRPENRCVYVCVCVQLYNIYAWWLVRFIHPCMYMYKLVALWCVSLKSVKCLF